MARPGVRTLARQRALQLMFALEHSVPGTEFATIERSFLSLDTEHRRGYGPFARALASQAWAARAELDERVSPALQNWSLERLPLVDRLCLRLALCEMRDFAEIPLRVTINEAIELARMFSTDDSPQFINAVLDRLGKDFAHKDFEVERNPEEDSAPPLPDGVRPLQHPRPSADVPAAKPAPAKPRIQPSGWVLRSDGTPRTPTRKNEDKP